MKYRIAKIHSAGIKTKASVLIIYAGGTMGMVKDAADSLVAINFNQIMKQLPDLDSLEVAITVISFAEPLDSSNMNIHSWIEIGQIIYKNYHNHDGFIVLQGTDTMAYSASALSFMLEGLKKPVIFTGAQLPISAIRSDARPNLISAIEIASMKRDGMSIIPEVCIFFDYQLLRGNRTTKIRSSKFDAFESENYPPLAEVGISIEFNYPAILKKDHKEDLTLNDKIDHDVAILKIFPSIKQEVVESILNIGGLKGVILETYGSGNAPTYPWFIDALREALEKGVILFNVSQCLGGTVVHGRYATSKLLGEIGVVSGWNITSEAAVTKMMYLLGKYRNPERVKKMLAISLCGELDTSL
jgi:L-asparaginase